MECLRNNVFDGPFHAAVRIFDVGTVALHRAGIDAGDYSVANVEKSDALAATPVK